MEKGKDQPSASSFPEKRQPEGVGNRKLSIVLVEDNPTDVFLVEQALANHKIDATLLCHRDGEAMLRYINDIDRRAVPCPDLILLDLNLPRHGGKAILARIRNSALCGDVPVVIVTSSKAAEDEADAARLGATRYFYKSIDYDEAMALGAVVREVTRLNDEV
jgi:DNA-binding response OmpR family regulator